MEWHVNDLSIDAQYSNSDEVKAALMALLSLRNRRADLKNRLFCSRQLGQCLVLKDQTLRDFTLKSSDHNFRAGVLRWIGNQGPFWTDDRRPVKNNDDLFYLEDIDITDCGLGEVARRTLLDISAAAFSFEDCAPLYRSGSLDVMQGLPDDPLDNIIIGNTYGVDALEACRPIEVKSWPLMMELAITKKWLLFSPNIGENLQSKPFSTALATRLLQLLQILSDLAEASDDQGVLSATGLDIRERYFVGKNSWFSDESQNDAFFFPDPTSNASMYCSWHGKTKQGGEFRVHFEWPRPAGKREIKVGYIGMKLTKW